MKFSRNWLADYVPGLTADGAELGRQITMRTAECEGVEDHAPQLKDVCVARVESVEPIAGSPNVKAVVETGRYGRKTLVCGAPNCRAGLLTAYWPLGVKKIAGVGSEGMLCAGDELGINRDHNLIVELTDVAVGDPLPGLVPDAVIDIDNKSLTHRPDLWGHFGMAREVAATFGLELKDPTDISLLPSGEPQVNVQIEDFTLCPRFSAVVFENVKVAPSPLWFQYRLQAVGLNPINNIVDITNYVMAELPQPMHAFDADKVPGQTLIARAAKANERLEALNGETYDLDPSMIVVGGLDGPLAIAGIIGGDPSAIGDSTTRIIFEAANWNPVAVRKATVKLKLRTDASMRFEKSLDPENTLRGIARAIALMKLVCPEARLAGGVADVRGPAVAPAPIRISMPWMAKKLGRTIGQNEVVSILEALGFGVTSANGELEVTVPSWRATKDISMDADLVEEVGRIIGYASITPTAPRMDVVPPKINRERAFHNGLRRHLTHVGFTEVHNYSFVADAEARKFGFDPADHLRVLNPIAEDQALLRISLLPKIWKNIDDNRKHFDQFRLFEIGREIHKRPEGLPDEVPHLVAVVYAKDDGVAGLNQLKRLALDLLPEASFRAVAGVRSFEHPARTVAVMAGDTSVGRLFEFHPSFVEVGRAAVLELNLRTMEKLATGRTVAYTAVNKFPSSSFDLAVVVDARALAGDVAQHMPGAVFIEDYRLPDGRRSLLYRLTISRPDRTLTGEEVTAERTRLIEHLRAQGFELRA
ncbi:MAG: phenylalanine--tRNA ligase subunit beta [Acidobacteria bacterium]|nr:phenylalanine--tRNA ligase subunit beta [Acidobacteriota bacterium]